MIKVLWEWEGCPVPTFSEFWDKGKGKGIWSKQKDGLTCFFCRRECKIINFNLPWGGTRFDVDDIQSGVEKQGGDCPVIKNQMFKNLLFLKYKVAVEVPKKPSFEYLELLRALHRKGSLILLCPPEAEKDLTLAFPDLPLKKPPAPLIDLLWQIYVSRLDDAKLTVSPLPTASVKLIAVKNRGNPGGFMTDIAQVLDRIELDGFVETVTDAYAIKHVSIDVKSALEIIFWSYAEMVLVGSK